MRDLRSVALGFALALLACAGCKSSTPSVDAPPKDALSDGGSACLPSGTVLPPAYQSDPCGEGQSFSVCCSDMCIVVAGSGTMTGEGSAVCK